uniref:Uncharacterized protein n=1 Tax=Chromera velia CCMP2878 TaxID=1169474 RepID=A0A0G4HLQ0_9ALVE|eukprot:Cvel_7384.t1-p1 / transcript=Cvel_7384.t1 / gene=Cvel_7384 / organism=Chromera_velia_CCMP2878 / gene_product=hypothetical protein / transcript_product=hypothetical protein / location=Cvel_scaffold384:66481-66864(+) / protein_length=128 / sequence_SO=supercontig / SO=protein_coding / is_pseudo=false
MMLAQTSPAVATSLLLACLLSSTPARGSQFLTGDDLFAEGPSTTSSPLVFPTNLTIHSVGGPPPDHSFPEGPDANFTDVPDVESIVHVAMDAQQAALSLTAHLPDFQPETTCQDLILQPAFFESDPQK